ncbi:MAG: NAD(+)/NADH kinase [Actinomycetota bacterium]|nr:NAD(+)/NADH kinase [Actinomycetota bacterium]
MKIALVLHPDRESSSEIAAKVAAAAAERGIEVTISEPDASRVPSATPRAREPLEADFIVAVGGDGTVLQAARMARISGIPILGVNAGTVGFLAEVDPSRIGDALDALRDGDYRISPRMTLRAELPDGTTADALNDVVVEKVVSQHVVSITVSVGGQKLADYRSDAIIVATPTGSTAYTFSAGGPLVDPELDSLIMTAVAPHNLFGRAIVFGAAVTLDLLVSSDRPARVNVDGLAQAELLPGDTVRVSRGPDPVRLVRLSPSNFARTVKEKFHLHDA